MPREYRREPERNIWEELIKRESFRRQELLNNLRIMRDTDPQHHKPTDDHQNHQYQSQNIKRYRSELQLSGHSHNGCYEQKYNCDKDKE